MTTTLEIIGAVLLFALGLRLSAFFSGSETGFYRASFLRLSIDAHAGDRVAKRVLWFTRNPSYFVATTLVGNNVANYLATLAIGLGVAVVVGRSSGWMEIVATLLLAPLIFLFGELIPKSLYYRAPLKLLRRDSWWFRTFYIVFLPISFPLIALTKLIEKLGRVNDRPLEHVLGRSRLVQVLSQGHREGLLTDVQSRMANGLMHTAAQPVRESMTAVARILHVFDDATRDDALEFAVRYGVAHVAVLKAGTTDEWLGYLRLADLRITEAPPKSLIRPMPRIPANASKLEALLAMRNAGQVFAVVVSEYAIVGLVSEHGLIEQLFRPPQAAFAPKSTTQSTSKK